MRIIAWLAGIGTLLAGVLYMVVSLNRWEWNRALFFGLIVLIAEIGLATGLVLRRLARLEHNLRGTADPAITQILSETRPKRDRFAWMRESSGQLNVFITFLVGGGVLLSAIAWVVDKVASKTSSPAGEERLARGCTRSAIRRAGSCSTTSPSWPRTCRAPTTARSASCCAAAGVHRDEALAGQGRARVGGSGDRCRGRDGTP